jgi:thioredoxin 1
MGLKKTSDQAFDTEVLQAERPQLVDFWAEWCGPCRQIAPFLEEIANDYDGKLDVVKVNIDENPNTPTKYGVRGIPTLMMFKNGTLVDQKVGALPKSRLVEWVDEHL